MEQQELDVTKLAQELINNLEKGARSVPYIIRGVKLLHEAILQASQVENKEKPNG